MIDASKLSLVLLNECPSGAFVMAPGAQDISIIFREGTEAFGLRLNGERAFTCFRSPGGHERVLLIEDARLLVDEKSNVTLSRGDPPEGSVIVYGSDVGFLGEMSNAHVVFCTSGKFLADFQWSRIVGFTRWSVVADSGGLEPHVLVRSPQEE